MRTLLASSTPAPRPNHSSQLLIVRPPVVLSQNAVVVRPCFSRCSSQQLSPSRRVFSTAALRSGCLSSCGTRSVPVVAQSRSLRAAARVCFAFLRSLQGTEPAMALQWHCSTERSLSVEILSSFLCVPHAEGSRVRPCGRLASRVWPHSAGALAVSFVLCS